jgi:hypothetical protein
MEVLSLAAGSGCEALPVTETEIGATLYVGCYGQGTIELFDASNPASLQLEQTIPGIVDPQRIVPAGSYLLVPGSANGGKVYEIGSVMVAASGASGVSIYYTIDGSMPSGQSASYTGPFAVSRAETIRAIAIASGQNSGVDSVSYVIQ